MAPIHRCTQSIRPHRRRRLAAMRSLSRTHFVDMRTSYATIRTSLRAHVPIFNAHSIDRRCWAARAMMLSGLCISCLSQHVLCFSSSHSGSLALNNRRNENLIREHGHIRSSDRMLDEQINIAIETKEHLYAQRNNLQSISKRINQLTSEFCGFCFEKSENSIFLRIFFQMKCPNFAERYPAINSLLHKIQFKKRKDTIVVSTVIAVCLFLIFLYLMYSGGK